MFSKRQAEEEQGEFWIERSRLSKPKSQGFYRKLNEHLAAMDFARQVWALCAPAYCEESRGGRPGIDPVVYLKMLMVGFFENLRSERAIAARCEDSLSVRAFLGYGLEESTPDHSSLSVIRQRLGAEIYQGVFEVVLSALKAYGLFRGRHLGIDSSVIEANASLRTLVHRNTEQAYWEYVKALAAEQGVDPQDEGAVRRFDQKRPGRRTSNQEWKNPHDPQAKVGRTKDGACDMWEAAGQFHTTRWMLVMSSAHDQSQTSRAALATLCQIYCIQAGARLKRVFQQLGQSTIIIFRTSERRIVKGVFPGPSSRKVFRISSRVSIFWLPTASMRSPGLSPAFSAAPSL